MGTKKLLYVFTFFTFGYFFSIPLDAQTITSIAGNGLRGYSGDGGPSVLAEICNPWGICFDKRGNLFFSDNSNYRLREINTAGIITTIAGNGVLGYTGDGGPATAAELLYPQGITVDDSGNVYDAEYRYNIVRKTIASSGIIITYAGNGGSGYSGDGGPATAAQLNNPNGLRIDSSGNLYIVDCVNNVIREVIASSGIITTIAGNGYEYGSGVGSYSGDGGPATAAELNVPRGIGFDSAGNYYIADWHNNIIRKVTVSTGIITTVAGNYAYGAGYSGDGGPATLAELNDPIDVVADFQGDLYIADELNGVIRKVSASTGIISTVAGNEALSGGYNGDNIPATSAALNSPDGVAIRGPNIFICDQYNNRIREVDSVVPDNTLSCNFWTQKASLTASGGRENATGFSIGHFGYIGCGDNSTGNLTDFWRWNQDSNTWTAVAAYPGMGRIAMTSFAIGGKGYSGLGETNGTNYNDFWEYDTATNTWTQIASFPGAVRKSAFAFVIGANAYVGGGEPGGVPYDEDVWEYNSVSNTWTQVADFGGGERAGCTAFTLNGVGYAGCGSDGYSPHNDMWQYNPGTNVWTSVAPLPVPGNQIDIPITFVIDSLAYVGTGINGSGYRYRDFWSYSATTNTWTGIAILPGVSRWTGVGFSIGNKGYAGTGNDSAGDYLSDYWQYTPCSDTIFSVSANVTSNVSCNGGSNGSATAGASGGTSPYTYLWNPGGQTTATATGLLAGTYTITITDNIGLIDTATVTISQPAPLTVSTGATSAGCSLNMGSATATVSGGTSPYIYSWSAGGGTNTTISGLSAGTYTITVSDSCGASAMASATVTQPVSLVASTNIISNVSCFGGSNRSANATITDTGGGGIITRTFMYEPAVQHFTVPSGISTITVSVTGASGGSDTADGGGGQGASFSGIVNVIGGDILGIAVGSEGLNGTALGDNGGGGGASWVYDSTQTGAHTGTPATTYLYAVAGGGASNGYTGIPGGTGGTNLSTNAAGNSSGGSGGQGGTGGNGGNRGGIISEPSGPGAGGAGWISNGIDASGTYPVYGGNDWANGFAAADGYGGSGAGYGQGGYGGGGGGGYKGGAGGGGYNGGGGGGAACTCSGGGGGSFLNGTVIGTPVATNAGNGLAGISYYPLTGTSPYTYSWSNGQTTDTATGLSAGTYTVTVTDSCGSTATATVTITQPNALNIATIVTANVSCYGGSNGSDSAAVSGGTSPYTYSWSNGETNVVSSGLSAGTYTVTVTDNNGCIISDSAIITQPSMLNVTAIVKANANCRITGSDSASASGGTSSYTYSWSNGETTENATGLTAGIYTVTVTDNNGCSATASNTITQPVSLVLASNITDSIKCNGGSNGSDSVSVSGGVSPYTYLWSNGETTAVATGLSAGTYSVLVTDNNGCYSSIIDSITQPTILTITANVTSNVSCYGGTNGSAVAFASGGGYPIAIITTMAGDGTAGYNGDGIAATTAELAFPVGVTVDGSGNIYIVDNQNNRIREVNTSGKISTLAGNGTGGYNGDGISATMAELIEPAGVAVDASGNIYIADQVNNRIRIVNTSGIISTVAGNGTAGYNGDGTAATTAELFYPTSVAVDGSGNIYIADSYNNVIRKVNTSGIISTVAGNGFDAGTFSGGYYGDGGPATSAELYQPTGVAEDVSGNIYVADERNNRIRKVNTSGIISTEAGNGITGYNGDGIVATSAELYNPGGVWVDASGNIYIADIYNQRIRKVNTSGIIGTVAGNGINGYNGDGIAATMAELNYPGGVYLDGFGNIYIGDTFNQRVRKVSSGSSTTYTYSWSPGGGTNDTASNLSAGTYTVTVTNSNGCTATATVTITQPPILSVSANITANLSCSGGNTGSASSTVSGGTSPYTYLWSDSGSQTTANASGLSSGTYTINVTDNNGCTGSATATITQSVVTITIASRVILICDGYGYITAHAATGGAPPYTYSWSPNGGTNLATTSNLSAGTYTITATDNNGCSGTASESITLPPQLTVTATITAGISCYEGDNGSVSATASGGSSPYTYSWFPSGGTNPTEGGLGAGEYIITVTDSNGCAATAAITLTQPQGMAIMQDSINQNGVCDGEASVTVISGGVAPYTYLWTGGLTTDTIKGQCSGDYCCTITGSNGCSQTTCVTILNATGIDGIESGTGQITVYPNPNNGEFTIQIRNYELGIRNVEIYDVLGQKVYSTFTTHHSSFTIDLSYESSGVYFYRVLKEDGSPIWDGKIVIIR